MATDPNSPWSPAVQEAMKQVEAGGGHADPIALSRALDPPGTSARYTKKGKSAPGSGSSTKSAKPSRKDTQKAEDEARQMVAQAAGGTMLPDQLKAEQDKAAKAVKDKGATSSSAIQQLLAGQLGRVTLSTRLPPEIVSMTHGVPDDATLDKALKVYNASQHSGPPIKTTTDLLQQLANRDVQATMALSQVVGGEPTTGVNIPLGPQFGNKQMFLNDGQQKAYQTYWPTAFSNVATIAQYSALGGVPHQLLAAASEANRSLLIDLSGHVQPGHDAVNAALAEYDLSQRLEEGMKTYGDATLALISTRDPNLADKIKNGVPLSDEEKSSVRQLFLDAKFSDQSMSQAGLAIDPVKFNYVNNLVGGDGSSGGAAVKLPAHQEVQQALETVYRAWFMEAPSKATLDAFTATVNAAAAQSQKGSTQAGTGNPYQVSSQSGGAPTVEDAPSLPQAAIDYARNDPQYARFFSKKPVNLDESSYAQQFSNTAQRFFGDAGAGQADAIGQGMESGDVNQVAGHLAGQANAMDNATFRERLAQAASAVGKMV